MDEAEPSVAEGASTPTVKLRRLQKRAEFLFVAQGIAAARGAVLIQGRPREGAADIGVGFTATKKIGNAVTRNRAKRRLREAARAMAPLHGQAGHDYVLIARSGTTVRPWDRLVDDVKSALISLRAGGDPARPPRPPRSSGSKGARTTPRRTA